MLRQTALVVGSSGNIGVAIIVAALRTNFNVLAVVRNDASKNKIIQHLAFDKNLNKDDITFVEADVLSDDGVAQVVDKVKAGSLPDFQHVFSGVGVWNPQTPIYTVDTATLRSVMTVGFESAFFAYRATVPYLLQKKDVDTSWTVVTGGAGELGSGGVTATSQGALFSLANVGRRENAGTNLRFNEIYLNYRVDYDSVCEQNPFLGSGSAKRMKSSEFGRVYEQILKSKDIAGTRVSVAGFEDLDKLNFTKKSSSL